MLANDRNKLNRVEELKNKLFSKNYETKIEHRDNFSHSKKSDIPDGWESGPRPETDSYYVEEKFFMKTKLFKNFFAFSLIFFLLTAGYASFRVLTGGNTVSNDNIEISITGNNFVAGGEELSFIVGVSNKNSSDLKLVDLIMEYPKSASAGDVADSGDIERSRISLGTIPSGKTHEENLKVVLFGEQGSIRTIKVSIEYRVEDSNAIFVKEKIHEVTLSSTPLNLTLEAPLSVSANQDFTFNVKVALNSTRPASKVLVKFDYPLGFQFKSATPEPIVGNNVWDFGDLAPGAERTLLVTGKMIDAVDGEEKTFRIMGGSQSTTDTSEIGVIFNSLAHTLSIKKPFIEAELLINGVPGREYAVDSKSSIHGQIRWTNNLDTRVDDLEIRAKISGNAANRNTISVSQGFYNSNQEVIVWDKNTQRDFDEINPGDSGSVGFTVSPLSLFSPSGGLLNNPVINIDVSISGKQSVDGFASGDLNNSASSVIRIISDLGLGAKALFYSGGFPNKGPIPPKVGQETTYTIVWSLSNTANNISRGVVKSSIPSWMRFVGTFKPDTEDLVYDSANREIVWNIGNIPRGSGITGAEKSVSFQVAFTPSLSQVGTIPVIINEAILTAYDDFAKVNVKTSKSSLRTMLDSEPNFPSQGASVVE